MPAALSTIFHLLPLLLPFSLIQSSPPSRGTKQLVDETQFQLPAGGDNSLDFEADVRNAAEFGDIYDESLAQLPRFELFKLGRNEGWTRLPIVTRKKSLWSTPLVPTVPGTDPWTYTTPSTRRQPSLPAGTRRPLAQQLSPQQPLQIETLAPSAADETSSTTTSSRQVEGKMRQQQRTTVAPMAKNRNSATGSPLSVTGRQPPAGAIQQRRPGPEELLRSGKLVTSAAGPFAPSPAPIQRTVVEVKSNRIAIRPPVPGEKFAWSRSWSLGPDGRLELRTWDSKKGERVEQRLLNSAEKGIWLAGGTTFSPATTAAATMAPESSQRPPRRTLAHKPTFIQSEKRPHMGPTFQCRVLDAARDGRPSEGTDQSCPLSFPGIPADDTCKCTYEVTERDENGCAMGFIFTCQRQKTAAVSQRQPAAEEREEAAQESSFAR